MKLTELLGATAIVACAAMPALADGDLSRANVQQVTIEMGSNDDGMYFKPAEFTFHTGQAYDLVMINVDDIKHEVSLNEMTERIFTRKVEIETPDEELVAEVKGQIHEVEIGPHQTVHWFFVPVQTVEDVEITCEIPGHYESGMHAKATIK